MATLNDPLFSHTRFYDPSNWTQTSGEPAALVILRRPDLSSWTIKFSGFCGAWSLCGQAKENRQWYVKYLPTLP